MGDAHPGAPGAVARGSRLWGWGPRRSGQGGDPGPRGAPAEGPPCRAACPRPRGGGGIARASHRTASGRLHGMWGRPLRDPLQHWQHPSAVRSRSRPVEEAPHEDVLPLAQAVIGNWQQLTLAPPVRGRRRGEGAVGGVHNIASRHGGRAVPMAWRVRGAHSPPSGGGEGGVPFRHDWVHDRGCALSEHYSGVALPLGLVVGRCWLGPWQRSPKTEGGLSRQ